MLFVRRKKNMNLYYIAIAVTFVSVVVLCFLQMSHMQIRSLQSFQSSLPAKYNAESGIQDFMSKLNMDVEYDLKYPDFSDYTDDQYDKYISQYFTPEEMATNPMKIYKGFLNGSFYLVVVQEVEKNYVFVDSNYDNVLDQRRLENRTLKVVSIGYKNSFTTTAYAKIFIENGGKPQLIDFKINK